MGSKGSRVQGSVSHFKHQPGKILRCESAQAVPSLTWCITRRITGSHLDSVEYILPQVMTETTSLPLSSWNNQPKFKTNVSDWAGTYHCLQLDVANVYYLVSTSVGHQSGHQGVTSHCVALPLPDAPASPLNNSNFRSPFSSPLTCSSLRSAKPTSLTVLSSFPDPLGRATRPSPGACVSDARISRPGVNFRRGWLSPD
jgi:hypothetical protein